MFERIKTWKKSTPIIQQSSEDSAGYDNIKKQEKEKWGSGLEFLLSCISMSVGLGNVWRFPFTSYENGGGAFLVPYLVVLTIVGRPLYYMELCMGQFSSSGVVEVWDMVPAFRGIGYMNVLVLITMLSYVVAITSISLLYFFYSFTSPLPWAISEQLNETVFTNGSLTDFNLNLNETFRENSTTAEKFYLNEVLGMDPNGLLDGISAPRPYLSLTLLLTWLSIFLVIWKGVRSSGKVAYFTALFPYLVLFTLLAKAVSLPGAVDGLLYFVTPQWAKLLEPKVWLAAIGQCFFSLSVTMGNLIMLSSHNEFRRNVFRDAVIVSGVDTVTSIICGCLAFSVLGYLAETMGIDRIEDVIKGGGTTLAFITYPDVLSRFDSLQQFFSAIFFLMIFVTGLGSFVPSVMIVDSILQSKFNQSKKTWISFALCLMGFLSGLIYMTPQGQYIIFLVDHYVSRYILLFIGLLELIAVQWIYGYRNFARDIEFMLNRKTSVWYFGVCWKVLAPLFLLSALVGVFLEEKSVLQMGSYIFGPTAKACGILMVIIIFSPIVIAFLKTFFDPKRKTESVRKRCFSPREDYGPRNPVLLKEYQELKQRTTEGCELICVTEC